MLRYIVRCRECFDEQNDHFEVATWEGRKPTWDAEWDAFTEHKRRYHPELVPTA